MAIRIRGDLSGMLRAAIRATDRSRAASRPGVGLVAVLLLAVMTLPVAPAFAAEEPPDLAEQVADGSLPPLAERLPEQPLQIDLAAQGLRPGQYGGRLRTLITTPGGVRYMTAYGYARLVGFTPDLKVKLDVLSKVEEDGGRIFTLHLRKGHKWSDGHPFTSEDFRYYWEDIANNPELRPAGPLAQLLLNGEAPQVEIIDEVTVRYSWSKPNPAFLPLLAEARPPFIYRPAHYLKQFHKKYGDPAKIAEMAAAVSLPGWAPLHNRYDAMYNNTNPDLPTLQPWVVTTASPASQFIFRRNPYFHRVDADGQQLPYIGEVEMTVARLEDIPVKAAAGDTDLQAQGLSFSNVALLKVGEFRGADYRTVFWPTGKSSFMALYPNLNTTDETWRLFLRDASFRQALSLGIDRESINKNLFLGLARPVGNAILPPSPLFDASLAGKWSEFDLEKANAMLDELGLVNRDDGGYRILPDGRQARIIVETAGEIAKEEAALHLITETWKQLGIRLFVKPLWRDLLRERSYSGETVMSLWQGWDVGMPTAWMSPDNLAPTDQDNLAWPKWGQFHQTSGAAGEAPDLTVAQNLMTLFQEWTTTLDPNRQAEIWRAMLEIHAEQQFVIGIVSSVHQPVVVSKRLQNVPETAIYSWDPGALFGIHGPDQFWFEAAEETAD